PNKAYFCRTMELIVHSTYFTLHQCDQQRCFNFQVAHKSATLTFCQLLNLRNRVNAMDLEAHFDSERNPNGLEILTFCNRRHLIVLNTYDVIDLKEMMTAAFSILQGPRVTALAM